MADEEWIERLARSMCREAGLDPDAASDAADPVEPDPKRVTEAPVVPAWTAYAGRAQAHLTAARALKMI